MSKDTTIPTTLNTNPGFVQKLIGPGLQCITWFLLLVNWLKFICLSQLYHFLNILMWNLPRIWKWIHGLTVINICLNTSVVQQLELYVTILKQVLSVILKKEKSFSQICILILEIIIWQLLCLHKSENLSRKRVSKVPLAK